MFNRDTWSEIFYSIKKNKLRTFLTGFSVAWGIFILAMLLGAVKGLENGFKKQFGKDNMNSMFINAGSTRIAYKGFESGRRIRLTNKDIAFLKNNFKKEIEYISPKYSRGFTAKFKNETGVYRVTGVNNDYNKIQKINIIEGRFLSLNDILNRKKFVVIGEQIKKDLFKNENPIGNNLVIGNSSYTVVGIFSVKKDNHQEKSIYTPINTLQKLFKNTDKINTISLTYNKSFNITEIKNFQEKIELKLKEFHKVSPDDRGFYFNSSAKSFSQTTSFISVLNGISIAFGLLILLAGIVGIGNILVFIIKERTKEIGIRKALGAKPSQIISLVLLESIFITTVSGLIGVLFAMLILNSVGPLIDNKAFSNPSVDLKIVITSLIILIVSGILAGLIPAMKAAKVKPIVALRND